MAAAVADQPTHRARNRSQQDAQQGKGRSRGRLVDGGVGGGRENRNGIGVDHDAPERRQQHIPGDAKVADARATYKERSTHAPTVSRTSSYATVSSGTERSPSAPVCSCEALSRAHRSQTITAVVVVQALGIILVVAIDIRGTVVEVENELVKADEPGNRLE